MMKNELLYRSHKWGIGPLKAPDWTVAASRLMFTSLNSTQKSQINHRQKCRPNLKTIIQSMWIEDGRNTKTYKNIQKWNATRPTKSSKISKCSPAALWLPNLHSSPATFGGFASHQGHTVLQAGAAMLSLSYFANRLGSRLSLSHGTPL